MNIKRININLPKELVEKLDNEAKFKYTNRTELIKIMIIDYFENGLPFK